MLPESALHACLLCWYSHVCSGQWPIWMLTCVCGVCMWCVHVCLGGVQYMYFQYTYFVDSVELVVNYYVCGGGSSRPLVVIIAN